MHFSVNWSTCGYISMYARYNCENVLLVIPRPSLKQLLFILCVHIRQSVSNMWSLFSRFVFFSYCNSLFLHWDYNGICGGHSDQSNQAIMWYMGVWTTIVSITVHGLCFLLFPLLCKLILTAWVDQICLSATTVRSFIEITMVYVVVIQIKAIKWYMATTIVSITIASCLFV